MASCKPMNAATCMIVNPRSEVQFPIGLTTKGPETQSLHCEVRVLELSAAFGRILRLGGVVKAKVIGMRLPGPYTKTRSATGVAGNRS